MAVDSEDIFYLVDQDGYRRVPCKVQARDGRYGYAVYPKGKGNDASAVEYLEDVKQMVRAVVLQGKGVRARAGGGPKVGQVNTLGLSGRIISRYWLAAEHRDWIDRASPPNVPAQIAPHAVPHREQIVIEKSDEKLLEDSKSPPIKTYKSQESIAFSAHCCQAKNGGLAAGPFVLDDLTMVVEGPRRLRFAPLGNRPARPRVALVGITPGGQIDRFAKYLAVMDVASASRKAAFFGAQTVIKDLLSAHGFSSHIGISLQGDLNESPDVLTTSIVKCCLMVDEGYRFGAPDIAASSAATHCATQRFVKELSAYASLKWVVVFGEPGWNALHALCINNKTIIEVLRGAGLKVLQMPHFAQNFQQRALFMLNENDAQKMLVRKPDYAKYASSASAMRNAVVDEVASI